MTASASRGKGSRLPAATGAVLAASLAFAAAPALAASPPPTAGEAQFRAIYKELIETNTTLSSGSCTLAAQRMAARLSAAGFSEADLQVIVAPDFPRQGNLVVRLDGSDASLAPVLFLAHIDVVEAKRSDWERDPFTLIEEGGYFYARGAVDDKAMAASFVDAFARLRKAGYKPRRTIKLALTCGEETDDVFSGISYLIANHPETVKAGFAINEGGKGQLDEAGEYKSFGIEAGQKIYQDFTLTTTAPGGHSARPVKDNAIVRMSKALARIGDYTFPTDLIPASKGFFAQSAAEYDGELGAAMTAIGRGNASEADFGLVSDADPLWNAMLRTTCIPTLVKGGHAVNAQPQSVEANVNCRVLPGESLANVDAKLVSLVNNPAITVSYKSPPGPVSPPPALTPELMSPIEKLAAKMWPGVPVIPSLSTGATDGRFLTAAGIPTYGVSGMFTDPDGNGVHGLDERIRVRSLMEGRAFLYSLVKAYAGG